MSDTLNEIINKTVIYDGEGDEWTLEELNDDASWKIRNVIIKHLESLIKPVPKPVFGDTTSIENAAYNEGIKSLIMDLEEGKEQ